MHTFSLMALKMVICYSQSFLFEKKNIEKNTKTAKGENIVEAKTPSAIPFPPIIGYGNDPKLIKSANRLAKGTQLKVINNAVIKLFKNRKTGALIDHLIK